MATRNPNRSVKSDETVFDIIKSIREQGGAGVTAIANDLDLSKGNVHAHLSTLESRGYVVNHGTHYDLGIRFLDLGMYARNQRVIYPVVRDKVEDLAAESEENARCIVEEHGLATFIAGANGKYSVYTDVRTGIRAPLHCISGGKAILAELPEGRVEEILDTHGLPQKTPSTITDRDELLDELEQIRGEGVAYNYEESIEGIHAVGTTITDEEGTIYGAISVAGAANRLKEERCRTEIAELVKAAANEIELDIKYA